MRLTDTKNSTLSINELVLVDKHCKVILLQDSFKIRYVLTIHKNVYVL